MTRKNLALIQSNVMDCLKNWEAPQRRIPIDNEKIDFGLYGDHTKIRPYNTVAEGVNWYLNQGEICKIPEELILPIVAHNFGMSVGDAFEQVAKTAEHQSGVVDLS